MNFGKKNGFKDISLRALKKQLRSLPDIHVPLELEKKLLEKGVKSEDLAREKRFESFRLGWNLGTAAAVIFLPIVMFLMMLFNLSATRVSGKSLPYDTDLCYPKIIVYASPFDQNISLIEDINFVNGSDL